MSNPIFKIGDKIQYLDKEKNAMIYGEVVGVNQFQYSNNYIITSLNGNFTISEKALLLKISQGKEGNY